MRILIAALGLAMLAGCASMNERRAEGPARSFTSQRDVATVAECVLLLGRTSHSLASIMTSQYSRYLVVEKPSSAPGKLSSLTLTRQIAEAALNSTSNLA